jgi:hypothetical protein
LASVHTAPSPFLTRSRKNTRVVQYCVNFLYYLCGFWRGEVKQYSIGEYHVIFTLDWIFEYVEGAGVKAFIFQYLDKVWHSVSTLNFKTAFFYILRVPAKTAANFQYFSSLGNQVEAYVNPSFKGVIDWGCTLYIFLSFILIALQCKIIIILGRF